MGQVLHLLGEGIDQAGEPPQAHPDREVLSLHVAGRDMGRVGVPVDGLTLDPDAFGGAVAAGSVAGFGWSPVDLLQDGARVNSCAG